ncbi:MAG: 3-hydroxyacyl-CoA dehydrogenase NAD-binding domain-containing protein, partial [Solirubrobacteraceae bacterium]|nr:3-hydroxyacyl-CoA dehydrogenase NAD-binding domain-containing protein [Solirubrobacteraceae bacterium]
MNIHTVAVLGAGLMGRGIAYVAALGGFRTVLQDTDAAQLLKARGEIVSILEKGVAAGRVTEDKAAAARDILTTV